MSVAACRVLVVDDDRLTRKTLGRQLAEAGYETEGAEGGRQALELLARRAWDIVLSDVRMPDVDGIALLDAIASDHRDVDVILMTAFGSVEEAVRAMKAGAADFLTKPFHFDELEQRLQRLIELRGYRDEVRSLRALLDGVGPTAGLLGQSPQMRKLGQLIETYANHTAPVLVTGETGTGKELVARALHRGSARVRGPFVPVPCGAIPTDLAESELFGHEKGAYTGASQLHIGAFERANGGTLLLDDVDDLPLAMQVKLLRVLQEGTFHRVGGGSERRVDVRVVATTKIDLSVAIAEGRFRNDLYYRLRGLELALPPLRERGGDVLLLAQHFLRRFAQAAGREEPIPTPSAAEVLARYAWPGNVRELLHVMEAVVATCAGGSLAPEQLPAFLRGASSEPSASRVVSLDLAQRTSVPFTEVVHAVEDELIRWAMDRAGGQQTQAAELLGLARTTFQSKLHRPG